MRRGAGAPPRYVDTEPKMAERMRDMCEMQREIYLDGLIEGVKIGLMVAICLVVMAGVIVWL